MPKRIVLTPENMEILVKMLQENFLYEDIAAKLGVSRATVSLWSGKMGYRTRAKKCNSFSISELREMWLSSTPTEKLATNRNCSPKVLRYRWHNLQKSGDLPAGMRPNIRRKGRPPGAAAEVRIFEFEKDYRCTVGREDKLLARLNQFHPEGGARSPH